MEDGKKIRYMTKRPGTQGCRHRVCTRTGSNNIFYTHIYTHTHTRVLLLHVLKWSPINEYDNQKACGRERRANDFSL